MDPIDTIFKNLDRWRHLPAYQLERRADIFFSVYLRELIEERMSVPLEDEMIPELPIERDLLPRGAASNRSVKVDYALFARDRSRVFLVELKTDMRSRGDLQDGYLAEAKKRGFHHIVTGICRILQGTKDAEKYHHLAAALERMGYLTMPHDIRDFLFPRRRGLAERLHRVSPTQLSSVVEVLYVQPKQPTRPDVGECIDFAQFAAYVARFDDPVSKTFAAHLLRWQGAAGRPK